MLCTLHITQPVMTHHARTPTARLGTVTGCSPLYITGCGAGEAVHYLNNLQGRVNVTSSSFCLSLAYGDILGNPVLVVASGIGPTTAALCTMELLQCR